MSFERKRFVLNYDRIVSLMADPTVFDGYKEHMIRLLEDFMIPLPKKAEKEASSAMTACAPLPRWEKATVIEFLKRNNFILPEDEHG